MNHIDSQNLNKTKGIEKQKSYENLKNLNITNKINFHSDVVKIKNFENFDSHDLNNNNNASNVSKYKIEENVNNKESNNTQLYNKNNVKTLQSTPFNEINPSFFKYDLSNIKKVNLINDFSNFNNNNENNKTNHTYQMNQIQSQNQNLTNCNYNSNNKVQRLNTLNTINSINNNRPDNNQINHSEKDRIELKKSLSTNQDLQTNFINSNNPPDNSKQKDAYDEISKLIDEVLCKDKKHIKIDENSIKQEKDINSVNIDNLLNDIDEFLKVNKLNEGNKSKQTFFPHQHLSKYDQENFKEDLETPGNTLDDENFILNNKEMNDNLIKEEQNNKIKNESIDELLNLIDEIIK